MNRIYAGIGSRETPSDVLSMMTAVAKSFASKGFMLRSGAADGADSAFELGAPVDQKEIHLPWNGYNKRYVSQGVIVPPVTSDIMAVAARHHPVWDRLKPAVKNLMCRNVTIVLGSDLQQPVDFVVCWTPGARLVGGTAQAMKVAEAANIPVYNLANPDHRDMLADLYQRI